MKLRIIVSTSLLSPYRVHWLDALSNFAEVDIYYLEDHDKARNAAWCSLRPAGCSYTLLSSYNIPLLGMLSFQFMKFLRKRHKNYDIILLDGYGFLSQLFNIYYLNKKKIPYCVNIDGMVPRERENYCLKKVKRYILSKVPYVLCGAKVNNDMLLNYGVAKRKICNHPFSSLHECDLSNCIVSQAEKRTYKNKLNIHEERIIISVGRFSYKNGYGKGYDVLLRAAKLLPRDVGWYIIGGQPTEEFLKWKNREKLDHVHFIDFKPKEELLDYYRAADVFVLMTIGDVWGLVVNEAMACGLPVITTDKCVAGLELIQEGQNGYIIPVGDEKMLAERLETLLSNSSLMEQMGKKSLEVIQPYTIENMARVHIEAFRKIVAENGR